MQHFVDDRFVQTASRPCEGIRAPLEVSIRLYRFHIAIDRVLDSALPWCVLVRELGRAACYAGD